MVNSVVQRGGILLGSHSAVKTADRGSGMDIAAPQRRVTFANDIQQVKLIPSVKSFRRKYGPSIAIGIALGILAILVILIMGLSRLLGAKMTMGIVCVVILSIFNSC